MELELTQHRTPGERPGAPPSFLKERNQPPIVRGLGNPLANKIRSPIRAEGRLAWTHSQAEVAPKVIQVGRGSACKSVLDFDAGDEFTLANDFVRTFGRIRSIEAGQAVR